MLVLSRKPEEIIYVVNRKTGDLITLTVLDVQRGRTVKLGLDDPTQTYSFIRKEVYDKAKEAERTNKDYVPRMETTLIDKKIHFNDTY